MLLKARKEHKTSYQQETSRTMKKVFLAFLVLGVYVLSATAQTVMITSSLTKIPNSSAIVQYNNLFGQWSMPDKDDHFPFAVIRVDLTGDEESVRAAKLKLGFDVGSMQRIESDVRTETNKILILVPSEIRNIYLTCGDGCEKQVLFSGHLESNAVYACKVEYQSSAITPNNADLQVLQELQELKRQLAQMTQQNASQQSVQSQSTQIQTQSQSTIKLVKNSMADIRLYGKSAYSYDGTEMDKKAMEGFLKNNCSEAYKKYMSGKGLKIAGWSLFGIGCGIPIAGLLTWAITENFQGDDAKFLGKLTGIGLGIATASVPLLSVGYYRTNHAHEIFNRQCATQEKLTLNLQVSQNGLGLALNF